MIGGFYFPSQEVRQRTSGITFQVARLVLHLPLEIEKTLEGLGFVKISYYLGQK